MGDDEEITVNRTTFDTKPDNINVFISVTLSGAQNVSISNYCSQNNTLKEISTTLGESMVANLPQKNFTRICAMVKSLKKFASVA